MPTDSGQLYRSALSGVFAPFATVSLHRASQAAPSLQSGVPLAWHASGRLAGAGGALMITSHLGGYSLKFAPMGAAFQLRKAQTVLTVSIEIGHQILDGNTLICLCGQVGCLETFTGGKQHELRNIYDLLTCNSTISILERTTQTCVF
jgi:hypothetical protein